MNVKIDGRRKINSNVIVPPDKSISHRSIMIGSLANGVTEIENFLFFRRLLGDHQLFQKS